MACMHLRLWQWSSQCMVAYIQEKQPMTPCQWIITHFMHIIIHNLWRLNHSVCVKEEKHVCCHLQSQSGTVNTRSSAPFHKRIKNRLYLHANGNDVRLQVKVFFVHWAAVWISKPCTQNKKRDDSETRKKASVKREWYEVVRVHRSP